MKRRIEILVLVLAALLLVCSIALSAAVVVEAGWSGLLEPGERTKFSCPAGIAIYTIPVGESAVVVGCHD